mmetsp:Transcript_19370/g.29711  ORF Transcript_19370/g.29711 Transcript_19370/m.29711 type:complete len:151 (-) Transcript_19370:958-1410(-)
MQGKAQGYPAQPISTMSQQFNPKNKLDYSTNYQALNSIPEGMGMYPGDERTPYDRNQVEMENLESHLTHKRNLALQESSNVHMMTMSKPFSPTSVQKRHQNFQQSEIPLLPEYPTELQTNLQMVYEDDIASEGSGGPSAEGRINNPGDSQ